MFLPLKLISIIFLSSFIFIASLTAIAQTPQPLNPTGTIQTTTPKFSGVASSLLSNVSYVVAISETSRTGVNNQYVNWWGKAGLSANDLLESNANRLIWNSTWEEKTRNGNPNGPATTVNTNSPSALTPGKTYYWHIVGTNGYKSAQASFTVSNVPNQPILSVTPNLNRSLFEVTWSSVSNVSYYELQRNGATIYTGGALKQDVGIGSAGTTYTFTLKACNAVGCSAGHSVPSNFPVPPTIAIIQTPAIASTSSNIPSFAALASSLLSNTSYTVVLSEAPRTGLNNQYIDYWSIGGLFSSDLLASNVNHVRWNTSWVKRTRYGNPDGPATILSNTSPATLTTGKTYYWQIVAFGANGGMSKSVEGRFTVTTANSSSSVSSSSFSSSSSAPAIQTATTSFTYDDLGRVETVTHPNAVKNTYTYDAANNRTKKESTAN
jgi:YD repeat-containing protein